MALNRDDDDEVLDLEQEEDEQEGQEEEAAAGAEEADGEKDDAEEKPERKPSRAARKAERGREHAELTAIREQNRQLQDTLREMSERMAASTESLAQTARGMGKPAPKPLEERQGDELAAAAARVRPAAEDNGASTAAYFREVAAINARYGREIAVEEAQRVGGEVTRNIPRPPSGPATQFLAIAPWLTDRYHNDGVQREVRRLARQGNRNMGDERVWAATVREALTRYGAAEGLDVNLPTGGGQRQSPAVGGSGRSGGSFSGPSDNKRPPYPESMKRMADEHKKYKNLPASKRYDKFYDEIVKPELE